MRKKPSTLIQRKTEKSRILFTCLAFLLCLLYVFADVSDTVVSVLDGDTIEVLHNQHPERIRPSCIDYPEKGQPELSARDENRGHSGDENRGHSEFPTSRCGRGVLLQDDMRTAR